MAYDYFRQPFPNHPNLRPDKRVASFLLLSSSLSDLPITMLLTLSTDDDADDLLYR